jgi:protoporphyrinogen oxidase
MQKNKVILIGAGLLGLRIADLLSQKGYHVELVEANHTTGGMAGTFRQSFDGRDYYFDYGPHLFFEDFKNDYQELIGNDLQYITGNFAMIMDDKRLSYPLKIKEILKNLPFLTVISTGLEVVFNRVSKQDSNTDSLEQWMSRRFGKTLFQSFYSPYIRKCNGLPPDEVAADWAIERSHVTGNNLLEIFWKRFKTALSKKSEAPNLPSSDQITAYYPKKGAGEITDSLTERIQDRGGLIHLKSRLNKLAVENGSVNWISIIKENQEIKLKADHYISTIPLPGLIKKISPPVSPSHLEAADYLKYRDLILMYLIINQPHVLDCIEIYFADDDVIFKRIYEPKTLSDYMAPPNKTSLCLEICCNETDTFSEERLYEKVITNLSQARIVTPDKVSHYFTVRLPHAYPIYRQGFKEKVNLLLGDIEAIINLTTIGRQGIFKYHAMTNETMEMSAQITNLFVKQTVK